VPDNPPDEITFTIDGGTISGGPFEFCVGDGLPDRVSGVALDGNNTVNSQWVVTDVTGHAVKNSMNSVEDKAFR